MAKTPKTDTRLVAKTVAGTSRIYRVEVEGQPLVALPAGRGWRIWEDGRSVGVCRTRRDAEAALLARAAVRS